MKRLTHLCMTAALCLALCAATYAGDMETTKAQPTPTPDSAASTTVVTTQGDMETTATANVSDPLIEAVVSLAQAISSLI